LICNNSIISGRNNQAFLQQSLNIAKWLGSELIHIDEYETLSVRFTEKRKKLLQFIFQQVTIHKRAFPSHATMEKVTGLSRSAVIRALKLFEQFQIIDIDHRNLLHKTNIYSLGAVLRNATVVRYLADVFKILVPAFCRTMERLGNLMFSRKPQQLYTGYFKSNATLSLRDVFVCSNTNTNTSLCIDTSKEKKQNISQKGEKMYEKYKHLEKLEEQDPNYMQRMNKIAIDDTKLQMSMSDQVTECMKQTNLPLRIEMFKSISKTVHKASRPYIEFLIRKYTKKLMEVDNGHNSW
jgi:hypothetical protein